MRLLTVLLTLFICHSTFYSKETNKSLGFLGIQLSMTQQQVLSLIDENEKIDLQEKRWKDWVQFQGKVFGYNAKLTLNFKASRLHNLVLDCTLLEPIPFKEHLFYKKLVKENGEPQESWENLAIWKNEKSKIECQQMRIWPKDQEKPFYEVKITMKKIKN